MASPTVAWTCKHCHADVYPEDLTEHAMVAPSGRDVVVGLVCECGRQTMLSWRLDAWNAMQKKRFREIEQEQATEVQRMRSAQGRKVAEFRRELELIDTVNDIRWAP